MVGQQPKAVLLTFCARDGDPYPRDRVTGEFRYTDTKDPTAWGPLLQLIANQRSELYGKVSAVYYLCHPAEAVDPRRKIGRSARDIARDMDSALKQHILLNARPQFFPVMLATNRPPNDHANLYALVCAQLLKVREAHPEAEVILQLSSGTSAMHAVLLVAGSVGIIPGRVRLVQSERGDGALRRAGTPFAEVDFELPTILRLVRQTPQAIGGEDPVPEFSYDQARSPRLQRTVTELTKAAKVRAPLLLRGERGVGKSSLAKVVRAASPFLKRKRPPGAAWASLACGQFADPTLLYVELCGAVAGAYTGLQKERHGMLRLADDDTLFLDEVHDLDHRCQRAIIRLVEDGTYTRLGDEERLLRSRFRLIAGTNLTDDALAERLSPDFLDRIRDLEISIPPLRDCREDLPAMWRAVCHHASIAHGVPINHFVTYDGEVARVLRRHPLPGNWRDLRRLATRLAVQLLDGVGAAADEAIRSILSDFCEGAEPVISSRVRSEVFLPNGHAANTLKKLEGRLGPGLERFWAACASGRDPVRILEEMLGTRHKARHAAPFIRRTFADRWPSSRNPSTRRSSTRAR